MQYPFCKFHFFEALFHIFHIFTDTISQNAEDIRFLLKPQNGIVAICNLETVNIE